jgi:hypothetical protein
LNGSGRTATAERYPPLASSHDEGHGGREYLTLHQLGGMRELLRDELFFTEGELTPEMERRWDRVQGEAKEKLYRFGLFLCEQIAVAKAIEFEEQRIAERRRARERYIEGRKERLRQLMERFGFRLIDGPLCLVTLQQNAVTITALGADDAPDDQNDLFPRQRGSHNPLAAIRAERTHHVRIR